MKRFILIMFIIFITSPSFLFAQTPLAASFTVERVSVSSAGEEGDLASLVPSISADGRYVVFGSGARNLVPGDTNNSSDIFVHDRQTGLTERVSVDSDGNQGNGDSSDGSISADGRYVAFGSVASNLVSGDTNGSWDIFVHDRLMGTTERVFVDPRGTQWNRHYGRPYIGNTPSISADGRYVAYDSIATNLLLGDTNNSSDIFINDRQGVIERVSVDSGGNQGNGYRNGDSRDGSISADGRYVAFGSVASNLVPEDTNNSSDIFVHDRQTGATERVSVDSNGNQAVDSDSNWAYDYSRIPSISADGRYVVFESVSTNLVPGDTNHSSDIFVHDRQTGATERVSVDSNGNQGNSFSENGSISANGRYVVFNSRATNLVPGGDGRSYIFVHDRQTGATEEVSVDSNRHQGSGDSYRSVISADGRYVVFESDADTLVTGDRNRNPDIFVVTNLLCPPPPDTMPPTAPSSLTASPSSPSGISLRWGASRDMIGVTGYRVYRNHARIVTLGNVTSYIDSGIAAGGTYAYQVSALDAAGNESPRSNRVSGTAPGSLQPLDTCSDSDGGDKPTVAGQARLTMRLSPLDQQGFSDNCVDNSKLVEYFCNGFQIARKQYKCDNCKQGVCKNPR